MSWLATRYGFWVCLFAGAATSELYYYLQSHAPAYSFGGYLSFWFLNPGKIIIYFTAFVIASLVRRKFVGAQK
jgi:hypothetical protein